jgi:hypothetical protein
LVRPVGEFNAKNWQDQPKRFAIVQEVSKTPSRGKADAWRFLFNHQALSSGSVQVWAIWLTSK